MSILMLQRLNLRGIQTYVKRDVVKNKDAVLTCLVRVKD